MIILFLTYKNNSMKHETKELITKFKYAADEQGFVNTNEHRHKESALICVKQQLKTLSLIIGDQKYMWTSQEKETYTNLKGIESELIVDLS